MTRKPGHSHARMLSALPLAITLAACSEPQAATSPRTEDTQAMAPRLTLGSGLVGSALGRGSIPESFKLKRKNGPWELDVHAKDPTDVAMQTLTFQPGGHSGWHSHPGPVFLVVTSGTLTFYEAHDADCTPTVRTAGQVFVETGEHSHIGRNEGTTVATAVVTVFAPPGANLRVDEPNPGNCSF